MRGKAGVISVLREADLHLHLGENATDGADGADPTKLQVGECEPDAGNAPNVTRHTIEPELEQRMRRRYSYPNPNPNPNPSPNPNPNPSPIASPNPNREDPADDSLTADRRGDLG